MSHAEEHSHLDTSSPERYRASLRVAIVNISANFVLSTAQVIIGILGHSQALVADGMHTLSDMFADLLVIFALKHGHKGADAEHPYGHERIETAVTLILGIVLIGVAIGIGVRAGIKLTTADALIIPRVSRVNGVCIDTTSAIPRSSDSERARVNPSESSVPFGRRGSPSPQEWRDHHFPFQKLG